MPRFAPLFRSRIAQRLVLQAIGGNAQRLTVGNQARPIRADEVHHGATEPHVPMEPQAAVHGVDHAIATFGELAGIGGAVGDTQTRSAARGIRVFSDGGEIRHGRHSNGEITSRDGCTSRGLSQRERRPEAGPAFSSG